MNGIINLIKPPGISSSGAIRKLKDILNVKKIGHGGTLDPNAVGVLPVLFGKATRLSEYLLNCDKTYIGEVTFGINTNTQDKWGEITDIHDIRDFSIAKVERVLERFRGTIDQTPPMYSAVKVRGQKLYQLARQGKDIPRSPRRVTIHQIDILDYDDKYRVLLKVKCSKGTYIRTLFADIGHALGWGGHMSFLLRVDVGVFNVNDGFTLEEIEDIMSSYGDVGKIALPMDYVLKMYPAVKVNDMGCTYIANGRRIDNRSLIDGFIEDLSSGTTVRLYHKDSFVALGIIQNNYIKPTKVFYGE